MDLQKIITSMAITKSYNPLYDFYLSVQMKFSIDRNKLLNNKYKGYSLSIWN